MIIVENLCFSYNDRTVFNHLNFQIMDGQWIALMGDNGSGKTTLVNILVGLLSFSKGNIWINNTKINHFNNHSLRTMIGIIFQNPDYQFVGFDVRSDMAFGLENQNLSRIIIQQKIIKYAYMLNIEHLLDKKPQELSGGQKQKVAIASVLVMEPQIIIFDESTAFLDPKSVQEIYQIIHQIHQQKKQILITITHDLTFALQSDEIMILNQQGDLWKKNRPIDLLRDNDFVHKYFDNLPLALQIYYQLEKEKLNFKNQKLYKEIKELLWQYNLIR
ncbi:energy-coupling factor ABC transporter ATP-binding protein [Candidatus Phytoplasma phoenicium]|uniref:ABC-type cobalt transport system, ATPase component n=1 Tax=Candidatus Phytoplasma phoenicium TaxID=198422 RepID=A0A0L0ML77_9MOLU|nr:ATP-binding cassette domain-containing protein [Candidatus Phytoplasma phoenicium]KND62764.1 ABC-type cobalt transport system, ATPase component [Candidatus Phytoplasma phoenicium]